MLEHTTCQHIPSKETPESKPLSWENCSTSNRLSHTFQPRPDITNLKRVASIGSFHVTSMRSFFNCMWWIFTAFCWNQTLPKTQKMAMLGLNERKRQDSIRNEVCQRAPLTTSRICTSTNKPLQFHDSAKKFGSVGTIRLYCTWSIGGRYGSLNRLRVLVDAIWEDSVWPYKHVDVSDEHGWRMPSSLKKHQ